MTKLLLVVSEVCSPTRVAVYRLLTMDSKQRYLGMSTEERNPIKIAKEAGDIGPLQSILRLYFLC